LLVTLSFCGAAILFSATAQSQENQQATPQDERIAKLLDERRETTRKLVEAVNAEYEVGVKGLEHVIRAQNELLDAELSLAKTHAARIDVHQQIVENLRTLEQEVEGKLRLGARGGSQADLLAAKSARLQAEIALRREQATLPSR
jgi:outer membrane protein TolC